MPSKEELAKKHCQPCAGGVPPLNAAHAQQSLKRAAPKWTLVEDGKAIQRDFKFKDFYHTMAFVNAVAWVANQEDHHPDLTVGYGHCRVLFTTHEIGGLSENDLICAVK
ncbi:MAG TPA: 4a-hydroxytetrahydrobiopterin dehydratase, partial [Alcanivoracaceae bacterium]|nr:4a-hydroxytetrahydrobiopterin dehydratase [Alcanivoracaceae bacterium]